MWKKLRGVFSLNQPTKILVLKLSSLIHRRPDNASLHWNKQTEIINS